MTEHLVYGAFKVADMTGRSEFKVLRHELRKARVSRAMGLLEGTDMKLMAVALEVGFAKLANFTDAFRRQTGSTPAQWRATRRDTGRMVRAPLRAVS